MTAKRRNNSASDALAKRYETALRRYLDGGSAASLKPATPLGRQAVESRFETLEAKNEVEEVNGARRTALYRVAQEALTNVARHAEADRVRIHIQRRAGDVQMSIKDNGKSFNVKHVMGSGKVRHLGLLGMKERVEMLGGSFEIRSAIGIVLVAVPLNKGKKNRKPS